MSQDGEAGILRLYPLQLAIEGAKIVPTVYVPIPGRERDSIMYHISDEDVLYVADRLRAERRLRDGVGKISCP